MHLQLSYRCKQNQNVSLPLMKKKRKSVLQTAIWARCSQHVLAHKSFQLAPKPFLISRIDYIPSVIWISPKNSTCPSGKLRTKITSPIAKSTSPWLSDTTFFARQSLFNFKRKKAHSHERIRSWRIGSAYHYSNH